MSANATAIVLGITGNWAFAAATVLLGLKRHHTGEPYDVIIFHDALSPDDQRRLDLIHPCRFIPYDVEIAGAEKFRRVSRMAFSRYECFALLERYETVVWLDADTLVVGDTQAMLQGCQTGFSMYLHENTPMSVSFSSGVDGFDMAAPCFNDGVFVINRGLGDGASLREWCYRHTALYYQHINSDQAVINLLLQARGIEVSPLDIRYNCHPVRPVPDACILHPWGEGKFWNTFWHQAWDDYYRQWLRLGGSRCPEYRKYRLKYRESRVMRALDRVRRLLP